MMRCLQPLDYLIERGWSGQVGQVYQSTPGKSDVIVLHRLQLDEVAEAFINYARSRGSILVYDTDDFIFSDDAFPSIAVRCRSVMQKCDVILLSTDYLADKAKPFASDVRVIRNGLSRNYVKKADQVFNSKSQKKHRTNKVIIGYCSGSSHHDDDLATILSPLIHILDDNPLVSLHLMGKIKMPDQLKQFGARALLKPFVPYDQFPYVYSEIDINIVPLVLDDPIVLGRSELKYIEAGACGVVTLASPSGAYTHAISHGVNGMLAEGPRNWQDALQLLINEPELRSQMGINARNHVLEHYGPDKRAGDWDELMKDIVSHYGQKTVQAGSLHPWFGISRIFFLQRKQAFVRSWRRFFRNIGRLWKSSFLQNSLEE